MTTRLVAFVIFLCATQMNHAQSFTDYFINKTLRVDYIFAGNSSEQEIYLDELVQLPTWAGRHHRLSELPLKGNGQITMRDEATGTVIYKTSFSSLFQEWLSTDEAKETRKSFENTFLLPYPKKDAEVEITLTNARQEVIATLKHLVRPADILIHKKGETHITAHKYLLKGGDEEHCIDVAILAEGYTPREMETFYQDAQTACESIFAHEPFGSMKGKFNVVAVASPSIDSGVSTPGKETWKHTAFGSHFDTFYSDRYLTTSRVKSLHDALAGIPYEHIIVLANTEEYGGGGIYNAYTLTTAHHPLFRPVVVHEFGHSFGGLADEYFYENDVMSDTYPTDKEPWEQNITTLVDFGSKWEKMLPAGTPIPTPVKHKNKYPVGVYEGGGYSFKGIYRPADDCRMRTNTCEAFCPVCQSALSRLINFYTDTDTQELWSQKMVESHGLRDFYCNRHYQAELAKAGWDYVSGLVANAVLEAWERYPQKTGYYDAVKAFADKATNEDGTRILDSKGGDALRPSNIDDLPAGRIYFILYQEEQRKGNTKDARRYRNAATLIRNKLKYEHSRIVQGLPGTGGFFHKAVYPNQMWLDGLYMGSTTYAEWQHYFGKADAKENAASWDDIARQFITINKHTYNPEKQLNYHAWSATPADSNSFWANRQAPYTGCSKEFWGRGMGWYFAALADVLEYMPKDHPDYRAVLSIFDQVAAGLKRWQDKESGVWYQLLQYDATTQADGKGDEVDGKRYNVGTSPNYLEASASCIFTYAYLKGIRLGLLDKATYLPVAEKAYRGLLNTFIRQKEDKTDIIQTCASAGLGPANDPSRTGTVNYYLCGKDVGITQNEGKAIGTFILASLEYEDYMRSKNAN